MITQLVGLWHCKQHSHVKLGELQCWKSNMDGLQRWVTKWHKVQSNIFLPYYFLSLFHSRTLLWECETKWSKFSFYVEYGSVHGSWSNTWPDGCSECNIWNSMECNCLCLRSAFALSLPAPFQNLQYPTRHSKCAAATGQATGIVLVYWNRARVFLHSDAC